jgi:hypothetical protein
MISPASKTSRIEKIPRQRQIVNLGIHDLAAWSRLVRLAHLLGNISGIAIENLSDLRFLRFPSH